MTRPDPRLLVPGDCLPFVPEGARVWWGNVACTTIGDGLMSVPTSSRAAAYVSPIGPGDLLDLSAPALRDGIPERLDALPWALAVLGWPHVEIDDGWCDNGCSPGFPCDTDITGLTPDEASRAVVAAALRGGR